MTFFIFTIIQFLNGFLKIGLKPKIYLFLLVTTYCNFKLKLKQYTYLVLKVG